MTRDTRVTLSRTTAALAAAALLLVGGGATYLLIGESDMAHTQDMAPPSKAGESSTPPAPAPRTDPAASNTSPLPDIEIPLGHEAVKRAGIVVTAVADSASSSDLRLPGVVAPNGYRQVTVTPLVSGRITSISAQLGDRVRRGATIAQIYSPELAEAETRYVSAVAMLEAHDRELQRTQKLVDIGAASRQELERIHAEHQAQRATVQSTRAQLALLGVPSARLDKADGQQLSATTAVPAPIDGVVTERSANVGLNVDPATKLLTIVDLSTVWIVADVHERDMGRIRTGSEATITSDALAGSTRQGRISYIDPQVSPETRTAKVRIVLPNTSGDFRLGMYVDVSVTSVAATSVPTIPSSAVQNVGDRTVVYLAKGDDPGTFVEREVRLGQTSNNRAEVTSGVRVGDRVVTSGSFSLRAERERLGLRAVADARPSEARQPGDGVAIRPSSVQTAKIVVTDQGFEPDKIALKAARPANVTFIRTSDKTCATEVVIPSLKLKRPLPINEAVQIEFTPLKAGEVEFACGMNMLRGAIVVQ